MIAKNKIILILSISIFFSLFLPLVSAASQIGLFVINPTGDVNVIQNHFFNVTLNISCIGDNCGEINVSLDPVEEHIVVFNESGNFEVPGGVTELQVLVVGGGGSGGSQGSTSTATGAGGVGAGGLIYDNSYSVTPGQVIEIIVGAGGIAPAGGQGSNGGNSIFGTIEASGGGGGGDRYLVGADGGSGGGGGYASAGGSGIAGQGYAGGTGTNDYGGSGGGGANEVGVNGNGNDGQAGGSGKDYSSIFGTEVGDSGWFAGGGGGGGRDGYTGGSGGNGGGGTGGVNSNGISGVNGTGGGGGGSGDVSWIGGNGGSGIVVIKYETISTAKGLINTTIGATPFYTNATTNPLTTQSLDSGKSEVITFWVNATGELGTVYTFFAYANMTSDLGTSNITTSWNVTIIEVDVPQVTINSLTGTLADVTPLINISSSETGTIWYNIDNGENITICTDCSSSNSTYLHLAEGSYTLYVFANDSFGNLNNTESSSFTIDMNQNYYDSFDDDSSVKEKSENVDWAQGYMQFGNTLWWNSSYGYSKQLNISNNDVGVLKEGYSVNLTLDTETMINAGKLKVDCSDLRVIWWNGINFIEIDRVNETSCDSASTEIWFKLQENISVSGSDNNYYIYFGNSNPGVPLENKSNIYWFWDDFNDGNSDRWTVDSGDWAVNANNEYNQSNNAGAYMSTSVGESWWDNYIVETKMNVYSGGATGGFASVLVRYQSAGNYYAIILDDRDPDSIWIRQFISGGYTGPEWDDVTVDRDTWMDLKVEVFDNNGQDTIRAYFDGIMHEYNYTQYGSGKIGLMMHGTQGAYDNVKVREYVGLEPTLNLGEEDTISAVVGNFTSYSINTTNNITSIDNVTWTESGTDANNNISVEVSADGGVNWYSATSGQALGQDFTGLNNSLVYRALFSGDGITAISLSDINISWSEESAPFECSPTLNQDWTILDTQTCNGVQVTTGIGKIIISGEGKLYLINGANVTTNKLEISTTGDRIFINSGSKFKVE